MSGSESQSAGVESVSPSRPTSCVGGSRVFNQANTLDLLVERFRMWKLACEALVDYFKCMSGIQQHTAKEFRKIGAVLQRSFPIPLGSVVSCDERSQSLEALLWGVREDAHKIAREHDELAQFLNSSIVIEIQNLQNQVKSNLKSINKSCGKLVKLVSRERAKSVKSTKVFLKAIQSSQSSPRSLDWRHDPWYCNTLLVQQLQRQIHQENLLQKSVSMFQAQSSQFEDALIKSLQAVWKIYLEHYDRMHSKVQPKYQGIESWIQSLTPIAEWKTFVNREECLLNPKAPLRDPNDIHYPGIGHPTTTAVHQGILTRKKKYKKIFEEGYYVVTSSGYMFQFKSASLTINPTPELSIFLPKCTLGEPTSANSRFHKFCILIDKKNTFNLEPVYIFNASSHRELMEWWNSLKDFCKLCSTSSHLMTRNEVTSIATNNMGYPQPKENSKDDDVPQNQDSSDSETSSLAHDQVDITSDIARFEPPRSTSSVCLSDVDRQKLAEIRNQTPHYNSAIVKPTKNRHKDKIAFNLLSLQSSLLVQSTYRHRQKLVKARDVQQHLNVLVGVTSATKLNEIEIAPDPSTNVPSQSTSSMSLDTLKAFDIAYENERSMPRSSMVKVRNEPWGQRLFNQSTTIVSPTGFDTNTAHPISLAHATSISPRLQPIQKGRHSI